MRRRLPDVLLGAFAAAYVVATLVAHFFNRF